MVVLIDHDVDDPPYASCLIHQFGVCWQCLYFGETSDGWHCLMHDASSHQVSMIIGVLYLLMGLFRLGFLTDYISHTVVNGFTSAAAIIIGISQVLLLLPHPLRLCSATGLTMMTFASLDVGRLLLVLVVILLLIPPPPPPPPPQCNRPCSAQAHSRFPDPQESQRDWAAARPSCQHRTAKVVRVEHVDGRYGNPCVDEDGGGALQVRTCCVLPW